MEVPQHFEDRRGLVMGFDEAVARADASRLLEQLLDDAVLLPGSRGYAAARLTHLDRWLTTPHPAHEGRTPLDAIHIERRRTWAEAPPAARRRLRGPVADLLAVAPEVPDATAEPLRWLLESVGDGVTLTQAGYLPRALVIQAAERYDWYLPGMVPRTEHDVARLVELHDRRPRRRLGMVGQRRSGRQDPPRTVMSLAKAAGLDVPDVRLVHRDELDERLPDRMWPSTEEWAYAVRRFDRSPDPARTPVHIEDFAQVRDKYPQDKFQSSFETVAAIAYRGHDLSSLREAVRRIIFSVAVGNGDAHLKNWSLIYRDHRTPALSPVYDLVSTVPYAPSDAPEDLGLKFGGSKVFERVRLATFDRLESALDNRFGPSGAHLRDISAEIVQRVRAEWPSYEHHLADSPRLRAGIEDWINASSKRLLNDV
ncbi:HipA domain-containing protein [Streptomyces sp. A3M-1-3]|uniref:type II toxin-antitoxin system HipA family toxin n=1 Tax=Streptomyces sp. A3M-1-3 TaxID=2962044 RepID=UPI0020B6D52E|nr:HipA domain-containing protein [Streptomyces sp. A3M-1-3]MCP3821709.1 HipA domain-containing protein [Streptomyces sp. A3M-1-3]